MADVSLLAIAYLLALVVWILAALLISVGFRILARHDPPTEGES